MERTIINVGTLNEYVKRLLESDPVLSDLWVRGEVSNFKAHYSGHLYLTLKDEKGVLKAVMFKSSASSLSFMPKDGMKVLVRCRISVYEPMGTYQAYIYEMRTDGVGDLHIAFEQLKEKLKAEGLFDHAYKKSIKTYPEQIGIITSATGAAIRDILNISHRRYPYCRIYIYSVLVQGEQASAQIAEGIAYFNTIKPVDTIVVARGGGSIEELWAFNEEMTARAIFASEVPVISAVGHETDFTIADFVADLRAPTPSAAAEIMVPSAIELKNRLKLTREKLCSLLLAKAKNKRLQLERLSAEKVFESFQRSVSDRRLKADRYLTDLERSMKEALQKRRHQLSVSSAKLSGLSPLEVLLRGYCVSTLDNGKVIRSIADVQKGQRFRVRVKDGSIDAGVL